MNNKEKYPIYDLNQATSAGAVETVGSKPKEWITYALGGIERRVLSKEGRPGTGENWAEKVACELAALIELPHAKYDFAILKDESGNNKYCVISPKFLEDSDIFVPGNQLIEGFDLNKKFNNPTFTLTGILVALQKNKVQIPSHLKNKVQFAEIENACELFIGYLCFDALIGNTDRHDENWGIIVDSANDKILAPTFDHASSLGRNESDAKKIDRMNSRDNGYNVSGYVAKALTPIYDEKGMRLNTISVVEACKKYNPKATKFWIRKIVNTMKDEARIKNIFDRVPDGLISVPAKDFALAILKHNTTLLKGLENE